LYGEHVFLLCIAAQALALPLHSLPCFLCLQQRCRLPQLLRALVVQQAHRGLLHAWQLPCAVLALLVQLLCCSDKLRKGPLQQHLKQLLP
jgi:hypothetical protein